MHFNSLSGPRRLVELTTALAWRDIASRYRGSSLGLLWTILSPILMMAVYGLAFGYVFKARWPNLTTQGSFVELLFLGIAIHGFLAECLNRSPSVITSNPSYVKRVVFPLGTLPPVVALSAMFNLLMLLTVYVGYRLITGGSLQFGALSIFVVLLPLMLLGLSLTYLLGFLGVYFRDLEQIVPTISTALLFLSSAIVPVSTLPEHQQRWFHLNPLTFYIDQARNALFWNAPIDWLGVGTRMILGIILLAISIYLFRRTRGGFVDVL